MCTPAGVFPFHPRALRMLIAGSRKTDLRVGFVAVVLTPP
jgi:hypothetical protein